MILFVWKGVETRSKGWSSLKLTVLKFWKCLKSKNSYWKGGRRIRPRPGGGCRKRKFGRSEATTVVSEKNMIHLSRIVASPSLLKTQDRDRSDLPRTRHSILLHAYSSELVVYRTYLIVPTYVFYVSGHLFYLVRSVSNLLIN